MSTQAATRPVGVDELKRAWQAVNAGDFRTGHRVISKPRGRVTTDELEVWSRATGEHTIAVLGAIGSAGASTVALAAGLAAVSPVRILECCSVSTSGLTAASTAELGLHADRWRQGKRDHVVLERASEILAAVDHVPVPTDAVHENQLTILDVGWEVGQLLGTDCCSPMQSAPQTKSSWSPQRPSRGCADWRSRWTCSPATGNPNRSPSPSAARAARSGRADWSTPEGRIVR